MIVDKAVEVEAADYVAHAKHWEGSGHRQADYCASNGLDYRRFVKCRKQLLRSCGQTKKRRGKEKQRFIPVGRTVPAQKGSVSTSNSQPNTIIVRLAQGSVVELPDTLQSAQLSIIFQSLGALYNTPQKLDSGLR